MSENRGNTGPAHLALAAIAGLLLFSAFLTSSREADRRYQTNIGQHATTYEDEGNQVKPPVVIGLAPPETSPKYFNQDTYTDEAALIAQKWMAWTAIGMLIVTTIGVLLIAITIWQTKGILAEAKATTAAAEQTVAETRNIGEAQVRAYLTCTGGEFSADEGTLTIRPTFKNLGQSPANTVIVHMSLESIVPEGIDDIDENMHRLWFGEIKKHPTQIDDIAPSETENGRFRFELVGDTLRHFDLAWSPLRSGLVTLVATGYVTWNDVFGKPNRQAFWLTLKQSGKVIDAFAGTLSRKQ